MKIAHPILSMPSSPEHAAVMAAALIEAKRAQYGPASMDAGDGSENPPEPPQVNEHGYPDSTPVKDMTVEQQAAYWKHQSRGWESRAKTREDYDQIKSERDRLKAAGMSPDEKVIQDARDEAAKAARTEERSAWSARVVQAEVRGALKAAGVSEDSIQTIVNDLNHANYLADDGGINTDKVTSLVAAVAPSDENSRRTDPDMGGGRRGAATPPAKGDAGRAEAERRGFIKPTDP